MGQLPLNFLWIWEIAMVLQQISPAGAFFEAQLGRCVSYRGAVMRDTDPDKKRSGRMKIKWMLGMGAGAAALLACGRVCAGALFFCAGTLMRGKADNKRTQKMAGTDWSVYLPFYGGKPPVVFKPAP